MAHIVSGTHTFRSTPEQWLKLGSQVGDLVNLWSGRGDLVAYVGEDGGQGVAPAIFVPSTAEVEINTEIAFTKGIKPEFIGDMTQRRVQFDNAKASGAIWHEAQHARYTVWDLEEAHRHFRKKAGAMRAMMNLEESRIEALGVKRTPENRAFMRACALEIVIGDQTTVNALSISPIRQMAHLIALTKARIDAGVLEASDITSVSAKIDEVLPADLQVKLRALWRDYQSQSRPETSRQLHRMYDIAEEWDKLVEKAADDAGEPNAKDIADAIRQAMKDAGEGEDGERKESGSGEPSESGEGNGGSSVLDALGEDAEGASIDAQSEADKQQMKEKSEADAADAKAKAGERADHKANSQKVFNKGTGPGGGNTNSRLVRKRAPSSAERIAANRIAQQMERAKYRERERIASKSVLPPGRMRTRALVQGVAMQEKGLAELPEAFRRIQHKQTDEPKLTVGMMVDISGSMSSAMEPMAAAAWVMSEAARRIQARIGMVYYGQDVFPTLKPGTHLDEVHIYSAPDSTEKFDRAFKAINGALDLLDTNGARLLVVVSDGHYVPEERKNALKWLQRCRSAGVGVLWIGLTGSYGGDAAQEYCRKAGAVYIQTNGAVTDAAMKIGQAAAEALTRVGTRV